MIIVRPEETRKIQKTNKWLLVYGRRKTGKTFLITNFVSHNKYFFVKKNKTIINEKQINYETFIELVKECAKNNKTVVVDEFHRLGEDFLDELHAIGKGGKLILVSSTLFLSKKLFASNSALLGLTAEVPIGLISFKDSIKALKNIHLSKKQLFESAVLLKEPICVDYFDKNKKATELLSETIVNSIKTVPGLVGEIFEEEERTLSAIYEGILRAIACNKVSSSEISSYLFARKLIKKDDPSIVQQYLTNLIEFGLIKKIMVFNKNKFVFKHISPLVKCFYYADEKYNVSERKTNENEIKAIIDELMPKIIEDNVREIIAEKEGLTESIIEAKDFDVDACLLKFKKPEIVVEVKWKKVTEKDVLIAEKNLERFNVKKKILFVPDKKQVHSSKLLVQDITDLY